MKILSNSAFEELTRKANTLDTLVRYMKAEKVIIERDKDEWTFDPEEILELGLAIAGARVGFCDRQLLLTTHGDLDVGRTTDQDDSGIPE